MTMMIMMLRRRVLMRGMKVKTTWVSVSIVCSVGGELAVLAELCSVLPDDDKSSLQSLVTIQPVVSWVEPESYSYS